jgi:hypothetical protein
MIRIFRIYSHRNFQVYNILLLFTVVTMLYIRTTELIHPNYIFVPIDQCLSGLGPLPHPEPLTTTVLPSYEFIILDSTREYDQAVFAYLCLAYLTYHSILQVSSMLSHMTVSFFFKAEFYSIINLYITFYLPTTP